MPSSEADLELALINAVRLFVHDPLGFVKAMFPWGSGELSNMTGPRKWQTEQLDRIGNALRNGQGADQAIQTAIASGHGIGKSAFVSWVILWSICTHPDTRGVVTANTDTQLRTKTWPEVAKWHRLLKCGHWFNCTATALYTKAPQHEKTWRFDAIPWSETNTEAFAGLHNQGKRVVLLFDEASAIADKIWEVAEGALTDADTEIIWIACGNPTKTTGRFRECFGRFGHRWNHAQIDSRTVDGTNKAQLDKWIADYGEDSDFCRVRVRGMFPRSGSQQFIPSDLIEAARTREAVAGIYDALVLGVDVARFGDDESVIFIRKGRDGRTHAPMRFRGLDTMQFASRVAETWQQLGADAVFVDGGGVGGGVVDRLRQLNVPVIEVQFGGSPDRSMFDQEAIAYANKGTEMWGVAKEWLKGGAIPDDVDLAQQLADREYEYVFKNGRDAQILESKKDMKARGLSSPDIADAFVLTFAHPVMPSKKAGRYGRHLDQGNKAETEYDIYATLSQASGNKVQSEYNPLEFSE